MRAFGDPRPIAGRIEHDLRLAGLRGLGRRDRVAGRRAESRQRLGESGGKDHDRRVLAALDQLARVRVKASVATSPGNAGSTSNSSSRASSGGHTSAWNRCWSISGGASGS